MKILKASPSAKVGHIPIGLPFAPRPIRLCSTDAEPFGVIVDGVPTCPACLAELKTILHVGRALRTRDRLDRQGRRTLDLLEEMFANLSLTGN